MLWGAVGYLGSIWDLTKPLLMWGVQLRWDLGAKEGVSTPGTAAHGKVSFSHLAAHHPEPAGDSHPACHRTEPAPGSGALAGIDVPGARCAPQCFPTALPLSCPSAPGITHLCPATALTSEDEEPQTRPESGAQHGGLQAWCLSPVKSKVTALSTGRIPQLPWAGVPEPPPKPWPHFSTSESFHLSSLFSLSLLGEWCFLVTLDLQFLRLLPLVNRDFAGGSSSCVNFCSSQLEMPLPPWQSPAFFPPSALPLAFFP